jgi:hypothetical protein
MMRFAFWISLCACLAMGHRARAEVKSFKIDHTGKFQINEQVTKLWGLRAASAAAKDETTKQLTDSLKEFKDAGLNTLLVCYQGGPGLSSKAFAADGATFEDTALRDRVRQILDAASQHDMVVVVSLFFPRKMGLGGQDPKLASRDAYLAACRTAAAELKDRKNVLICVCDQPLGSAFNANAMKFTAPDIIECLAAVGSVAPTMLRGGGNATHATNVAVASSDAANIIFHAEPGVNPPAFPVIKPLIHVGFAGSDSGRNPQGFYMPPARQKFTEMLDRYVDGSTAHFVAHFPAWTEGGMDLKPNRFDVGGAGTQKDPGLRWYLEALAKRAKARAATPGTPLGPGKSIFDNP